MGLLTLNNVEELDKKLQAIEKHLLSLEMKIDIISKENNSIKNIEANIVKIKNQMLSINKNIT
jgi:prefoldin subunit 5